MELCGLDPAHGPYVWHPCCKNFTWVATKSIMESSKKKHCISIKQFAFHYLHCLFKLVAFPSAWRNEKHRSVLFLFTVNFLLCCLSSTSVIWSKWIIKWFYSCVKFGRACSTHAAEIGAADWSVTYHCLHHLLVWRATEPSWMEDLAD